MFLFFPKKNSVILSTVKDSSLLFHTYRIYHLQIFQFGNVLDLSYGRDETTGKDICHK